MNAYPLAATAQRARDLTRAELAGLAAELREGLAGDMRADLASRLLYATDASIYQMKPAAVVFPANAADVQHVLQVAARNGVPVLPRGGGTSLAGQAVNHAVVLDFSPKMRNVIEINAEERWARVQPGIVLAELNRAAAAYGLQYAVDPSTANRATIGGGIGNNSCGAHSLLYGKTLDQLMDAEVFLADGTRTTFAPVSGPALVSKLAQSDLEGSIYREVRRIAADQRQEIERRFPKIPRRVSGYNLDEYVDATDSMDLTRILTGSEGTLAVITEARVRLVPLPAFKGVAAVHFRDVFSAAEATLHCLEHQPSAVELLDDTIIQRCRAEASFRSLADFIQGEPRAVLLVEFYGDTVSEVQGKLETLQADFEQRSVGYTTVITTDPARQRQMWRLREAGLGLLMSVRGDAKPVGFVEDTAVAPDQLPSFLRGFAEIVGRHGTEAAYYGHASVGCLHLRPMVNVKTSEGLETMQRIALEVADLVLAHSGSLSGEHGDGILRGVFTEHMFGPAITGAFREVKRAFDPDALLNPGKIIDTPGFTENLRLSPATRNVEPVTYLDFTAEGGIARAAEQCNGQGACRKLDGGMCPSYMVTLDEEHSTRGRANLLRQTFAGLLPPSELTNDRVFEALDLCVECKACKVECPSGVDVAKLKYEALAQRNRLRGVPIRSRLFANIATLSRLGSKVGPVANWAARQPALRRLLQRFGGIDARRELPAFAPQTFVDWFHDQPPAPATAARGEAVLFVDTFTNYFHPEVGRAAVQVMRALGYRVVIEEQTTCCGRPAISKGMLSMAKGMAGQNVAQLVPFARRGVPIVGTEPSCISALREEYPDLLRNNDSRLVASQTLLLDELVSNLAREDASVSSLFDAAGVSDVLLHAHCHQKAIAGADPTLSALGLIPGLSARLIDTGCCGMAGAFGFEAEHYDVSQAMGALRLFPAVDAADHNTGIVVTGVSCRQQIEHFTSRHPRHSAEILAEALRR